MKSFEEVLLSETNDIEFKESLEISKPKSWLKTVSAFANGIGGSIFWESVMIERLLELEMFSRL